MAGVTGLEPATSGVTGRRSNQLSYTPAGAPFGSIRPWPHRAEEPEADRTREVRDGFQSVSKPMDAVQSGAR